MRFTALAWCSMLALAVPHALAQGDPAKVPLDPIPFQVVIDDLRETYAKVTAEEVSVRFRSAAGERNDSYIIRIDPGAPGDPHRPRAVLLELGALRIYLTPGKLTAISSSAPDKVFTREFPGPVTPARLAEFLPPIPIPELAIVSSGDHALSTPLCHLSGITWSDATHDESGRPQTIAMRGTGPAGTIDIVSSLPSGRLHRVSATVRRGEAEGAFDLTFRPIDPGDPARWVIPTDGRHAVPMLTDLKPTPRPMGVAVPGQPVPNVSLSRFDMTGWTLHQAIEGVRPAEPLALLLYKRPADVGPLQGVERDALTGLALLRALHLNQPLPGELAPLPGPKFTSAAAIVIELGEFSREHWAETRRRWSQGAPPGSAGGPLGVDELMWSTGSGESIDRFTPGAGAIIIVVRADRTLAASIRLDGRPPGEVGAELRRALSPAPSETK